MINTNVKSPKALLSADYEGASVVGVADVLGSDVYGVDYCTENIYNLTTGATVSFLFFYGEASC